MNLLQALFDIPRVLLLVAAGLLGQPDERPFGIQVVDADTGRGVPLIELRTVHDVRLVTDSAGYVAFQEPGLMNTEVFFALSGHGYEYAADGFGFRGVTLLTVPGKITAVKIRRVNVAERLYRLTGAGIYADSLRLGQPIPLHASAGLLNAQVLGSDSVEVTRFRDRLYWFWGDTNLPRHPLGLFQVPGATSPLPGRGGLDPQVGIELKYFTDAAGRARNMAEVAGDDPTWITGLVALPDEAGEEQLLAAYMKIKPPLTVYERGWLRWDATAGAERFRPVGKFPVEAPLLPEGHPWRHRQDGIDYVYFGNPYLLTRVRATAAAYGDLAQYETYTAVKTASAQSPREARENIELDRDESGALRFAWRRGGLPWSSTLQARLTKAGLMTEREQWLRLADVATADDPSPRIIDVHRGSITWNAWRNCWIMIAAERGGSSSYLGEIWYAEAPAAEGPWRWAQKIVTHDRYSFYNPKQHAFFDQEGGRVIYFEGTYTQSFSGRNDPTARYEYNQIMYRLDLSNPRLERLRARRNW
ncbi:MAG: hypothetical protein ACKOUR_18200 [Planctomycetota bacterium]